VLVLLGCMVGLFLSCCIRSCYRCIHGLGCMVSFLLCSFILGMIGIVRLFFEFRLFRIGLIFWFYRMSSKSLLLGLVVVFLGIFLVLCFVLLIRRFRMFGYLRMSESMLCLLRMSWCFIVVKVMICFLECKIQVRCLVWRCLIGFFKNFLWS